MPALSANSRVRYPAAAGLFYPDDAAALHGVVDRLLANSRAESHLPPTKALIVPRAGYPYLGAVAAAAYRLIAPLREQIRRVVLVGPSHRVFLQGIALPQANMFATLFGTISIDPLGRKQLLARGDMLASDTPHALEHCLEVQLPFLQSILGEFYDAAADG